ncbi:MAG: Ig-like domain-containing protein [Candidatus Limivivens sp.]|nr:Ig-like domain-containing protein [Candidatus Limivivens sp.]
MKKLVRSLCVIMMLAMVLGMPAYAATTAKTKLKIQRVKGNTLYDVNGSSYSLYFGSEVDEKVNIDTNVNDSRCTWTSSNKSIATVSKTGVVTFKKTGKVKITCTTPKKQKKTLTFYIRPIKSVKTSFTRATMKVGREKKIRVTLNPSKAGNAPHELLSFTSSNKKVATVSKSGKITAVAPGKATITVKTTDGSNRTAKISITVPETDVTTTLKFNYSAAQSEMTFDTANGSIKFGSPSTAKEVLGRIGKFMAKSAGLEDGLNDMWIGDYKLVISSKGFSILKNGKGSDQFLTLNGKKMPTQTVKTYLTPAKAKTFVTAVVKAGEDISKAHNMGKITISRKGKTIVMSNVTVSSEGITFKSNNKNCSMVVSTSGIKITNCPELADYLVAVSGGLLK